MKKLVLLFLAGCAHTPYTTESVVGYAFPGAINKTVTIHNPTECTSKVEVRCLEGGFEGEPNRYFTLAPYGETSAGVTVPNIYTRGDACYVDRCLVESNACSDSKCTKRVDE